MKDNRKFLAVLRDTGAMSFGHYVLASGLHAKMYVNKDAIYMYPRKISLLCREIAKQFAEDNIEVVVAPALGGIVLTQWVAYHLSKITGRNVLAIYAEKDEGGFVIKRGYEKFISGKNILVVEDIFTTGGSVKKVVDLVRSMGGIVVGVAGLVNRGKVALSDVGSPSKFFSLIDIEVETWPEGKCPLCKMRKPINTDLGKGGEYLKQKKV